MQVQIAIGENHRFELREALLIYYGNQTTFITKHEVTTQQNAAPTLGPAQPLTVAFVESLVRSLEGGGAAEVFPENIVAKSDRMIAWWTPAQRRQMFNQRQVKPMPKTCEPWHEFDTRAVCHNVVGDIS
jgi:hypothetical protein